MHLKERAEHFCGVLLKYGEKAGEDFSRKNAFPADEILRFILKIPRATGAAGAELCFFPDGEGREKTALPFSFAGLEGDMERWEARLPLFSLSPCGGLFFYGVTLRCETPLFADWAYNGVDFSLSNTLRLTPFSVTEKGFTTPRAFWGGTLYHIFVDRFYPLGGKRRKGEVLRPFTADLGAYPQEEGAPFPTNEFFGGTLWGVLKKLPYLQSLGVTVLYLSPIFEAASNHKYDTGDYEKVDEGFGGEGALRALLAAAKKAGMAVLLDGVFNHTGDDSRYFNRYGHYPTVGAAESPQSPYFSWYTFRHFPDSYECWWGFSTLPKLRLDKTTVSRYFVNRGGVLHRYLTMGVAGFRLDVADELPEPFLRALRRRVKEDTAGKGLLLGEVWENAVTKVAYGKRRHYFCGDQLDGVMNYPLREGILAFVREGDAPAFIRVATALFREYPTPVCHTLMNLLSTHDTERILTVLGETDEDKSRKYPLTGREKSEKRLSPAEKARAVERLKLASVLEYTLYGIPSLFYGDEAGLEGYGDPFCRRPFPWGKEHPALLSHYRKLGALRHNHPAFAAGDFRVIRFTPTAFAYLREGAGERILVAASRGKPLQFPLPQGAALLMGKKNAATAVAVADGEFQIWRV